jgi:hypothetical protein
MKNYLYIFFMMLTTTLAYAQDNNASKDVKTLSEEVRAFVNIANEKIVPIRGPRVLIKIDEDDAKVWFTESLLLEFIACKANLSNAMKKAEINGDKLPFSEGNIFLGIYEAGKIGKITSMTVIDKVGIVKFEGEYLEYDQKFKLTLILHKVGEKWKLDDIIYSDDVENLRKVLRNFLSS